MASFLSFFLFFFFFLKNKLVRQQREDDTLQITKVMTYTTWEGGLWGTDSDTYCCFFFLFCLEMYNVVSLNLVTNIITTD